MDRASGIDRSELESQSFGPSARDCGLGSGFKFILFSNKVNIPLKQIYILILAMLGIMNQQMKAKKQRAGKHFLINPIMIIDT